MAEEFFNDVYEQPTIDQMVSDEQPIADAPIADAPIAEAPSAEAEIDYEALIDEVQQDSEATPEQLTRASVIQERTVIFELKIKGLSFRRRADLGGILAEEFSQVNSELRASKVLLNCPELDAIVKAGKQFKHWLHFRVAPCGVLRGGMHLVPTANVTAIETRFAEFRRERRRLVVELLKVYEARKAEAKARLSDLYDETDYPTARQVARAFTVDCRWLAFNAPEALRQISSEMWDSANSRLQQQIAAAGEEMRDALRAKMIEYLGWVQERLTAGTDGKRKAIAESKLADVMTFISEVQALNMFGDQELDKVSELAKKALTGVDVNALRRDDAVRESVRKQFETAMESMSGWIVTKERAFVSEDEV